MRITFTRLPFALLLLLFSCTTTDKTSLSQDLLSSARLYMTSNSLTEGEIRAATVRINSVEYRQNGVWKQVPGWTPKDVNLAEIRDGQLLALGEFDLAAGKTTSVRMEIEAAGEHLYPQASPCYLDDYLGTVYPVYLPAGTASYFEAIGDFVPAPGRISEVILHFDAMQGIHHSEHNGIYTLRSDCGIHNMENTGHIQGAFRNRTDLETRVVYVYKQGAFTHSEAIPQKGEMNPAFPNAIWSAEIHDDGTYRLAYLPEGTYDLVYTGYLNGIFGGILAHRKKVVVKSGETTEVDTRYMVAADPFEEN